MQWIGTSQGHRPCSHSCLVTCGCWHHCGQKASVTFAAFAASTKLFGGMDMVPAWEKARVMTANATVAFLFFHREYRVEVGREVAGLVSTAATTLTGAVGSATTAAGTLVLQPLFLLFPQFHLPYAFQFFLP